MLKYLLISYYKKSVVHRYDGNPLLYYFSIQDFDGLIKEDFSFMSHQNNKLVGGLFHYDHYDENKVIIFCHGIGYGYRAYMQEINYLASKGYLVVAYHNTGCDESEGESIRGLSQSLDDLDAYLDYAKDHHLFDNKEIIVIGHSWGGFASGNIHKYHPEIKKVIVLSGFISFEKMMEQSLKNNKFLIKYLLKYENKNYPKYALTSSIDSYNDVSLKALVIHSTNDHMVNYNYSMKELLSSVNNPNIKLVTVDNKYHNPNYTLDAVNYMNDVFTSFNQLCKNRKLKTYQEKKNYFSQVDYKKMTIQDDELFSLIIDFIEK